MPPQVSDVYLWYIGSNISACAWSGLSGGKDTWYNASSSCVVLVQEPGHSFGMSHSSSMACTDPATGAVTAIRDDLGSGDAATCTHSEYGNRHDTMGGGCRHFNAYNKVYRTYFQKCNAVNVRKSGTFNLMPIEKPCDGIQALQVPMPHVRGFFRTGGGGSDGITQLAYYTVELRSPIGFDTGMKPTVIINASPKWSISAAAGGRGGRGEHTWLLDMAGSVTTGTDGTAHALAAGQPSPIPVAALPSRRCRSGRTAPSSRSTSPVPRRCPTPVRKRCASTERPSPSPVRRHAGTMAAARLRLRTS